MAGIEAFKEEENWFDGSKVRRSAFLESHGINFEKEEVLFNDMAPRQYLRLFTKDTTYILQESPPDGHPQCLPGHYIKDYLDIQKTLLAAGLSVPEVIAVDEAQGLVLLEDFGEKTYTDLLKDGVAAKLLYQQAVVVLRVLRELPSAVSSDLPGFFGGRIDEGMIRFAHWFIPYMMGRRVRDDELSAFQEMKHSIFNALPPVKQGFVHGDFHPANLMPLTKRSGARTVGLLDFQGAFYGPCVYDLVNLLSDARRDEPKKIREGLKKIYYDELSAEEIKAEEVWYNALELHFHARVAGQFIKVAILNDKYTYLPHLPRVISYLRETPIEPFHKFLDLIGLDLSRPMPEFLPEKIRLLIRSDAI